MKRQRRVIAQASGETGPGDLLADHDRSKLKAALPPGFPRTLQIRTISFIDDLAIRFGSLTIAGAFTGGSSNWVVAAVVAREGIRKEIVFGCLGCRMRTRFAGYAGVRAEMNNGWVVRVLKTPVKLQSQEFGALLCTNCCDTPALEAK